MTQEPKCIVGLGELLWDLLPSGAQLGGAVSNFAVMAARLGDRGICASKLGKDDLGGQAWERLLELPVDASYVQTDSHFPTGSVSVALKDGQPAYLIRKPVAWDFLELTKDWLDLAKRADAVCFGTLAQRSRISRSVIQSFLAVTPPECARVFDVNLRPPFYSARIIEKSLRYTTLLKINETELPVALRLLRLPGVSAGTPEALLTGARSLLRHFPLQLVCVTMGAHGSILVTRDEANYHPGIATKVADTVGAGDAFTAALTHYYLRKAPLPVLNEAGNRWGSWVASQPGAIPPLDTATRESIANAIFARGAAQA